ncbi:cysteine-rich receptor-like protein kinase 10 [Phragmites australis]|uniref:cysteine-rich receptor-like protein kinase 10 n=1 Tax=Phragmites australis TaxID=29695 RepID=UPI002D77F03B|nr:cysteine-rich receptor-like protein kinase 10 [Phragmites australis]
MRRFSLLFFLFVLPLAADGDLQDVVCLGHGNRTAINSNYEANIHRLAAMLLTAKTSSLPGVPTEHEVGKFPDGLYAVSHCRNGTGSSSCRACITLALQDARRACPYHKEVLFFNGNCSLQLQDVLFYPNTVTYMSEFPAQEDGNIVMRNFSLAMVFQAIGFFWLFFLLLQDWRNRKSGSLMRSSSLPSGDKL